MTMIKNLLWLALALFLARNAIADESLPEDSYPCMTEEASLEACVKSNQCEECETTMEPTGEPDFFGEGDFDLNTIVEQLHGFLANSCDYFKSASCAFKECCPSCGEELDSFYQCTTAVLKDDSENGMAELMDLMGAFLGNVTGTTVELSKGATAQAQAPLPEINFDCDMTGFTCDATNVDGGSEGDDAELSSNAASIGMMAAPLLMLIFITL